MQTLRAEKYSPLLVARPCLCVYLKSYAVRDSCVARHTYVSTVLHSATAWCGL